MNYAISKKSNVVGDFHSIAPSVVPGHDVIMCFQYPTYDNYCLVLEITKLLKEGIEIHTLTGWDYEGPIEDLVNLKGTPYITGLSTFPHGEVASGTLETFYNQMVTVLKVNGNIE